MSFQKDALWDTRVFNSWLDDVDSVIVEVVVDDALSNSVVFVGILDDGFLEVAVEAKDLSVVLEPFRGNCWNSVLNLILAALDTSELRWDSLGH